MSVKVDDIKKRIKNGESMICTDPKGKLYKMVNKMYKRHNYIVREIKLPDGCEEPNTAKAATVIASSLNKEQIDESYSEDAKHEYDQINALISLPIADPNFKTNVGRATSNQIQIAIKVMEQNGGKNKTRIAAYKRELRRRDREYENRYLHRGKRTDTGEWVIGYLSYPYCMKKGVESYYFYAKDILGFYCRCIVDATTVCRCTGLDDKNGKLIWENDIVDGHIMRGAAFLNCLVLWNECKARFDVRVKGCNFPLVLDGVAGDMVIGGLDYEVVGNRFDNPELLDLLEV